MGKLLLAVGIVAFAAYMILGKQDKKIDESARTTALEIQNQSDKMDLEIKAIRTGKLEVSDPKVEARIAARQKEIDDIEARRKVSRAKDNLRVEKTEKIADDLDAKAERDANKPDVLDVFAGKAK